MRTPRSLFTLKTPGAFVDLISRGATVISSSHVESESAANGSSN